MPDIARWLPGLQAAGYPGLTASALRDRHAALTERFLA